MIGKPITELDKYSDYSKEAKDSIRKDFNLEFASNAQIDSIIRIFRGMKEYDRDYTDAKVPYVIDEIRFNRVIPAKTEEEKENERAIFGRVRPEDTTISVFITTSPDENSVGAYIKALDTKWRSFMLGKNGGFFTYAKRSRKAISNFDAIYGSSR